MKKEQTPFNAESVENGAIQALDGAINTIATAVPGIDRVENADDAALVEGQKLLGKITTLNRLIRDIKNLINLKDHQDHPGSYTIGHMTINSLTFVPYEDVRNVLADALQVKKDELEALEAELKKL